MSWIKKKGERNCRIFFWLETIIKIIEKNIYCKKNQIYLLNLIIAKIILIGFILLVFVIYSASTEQKLCLFGFGSFLLPEYFCAIQVDV